MQNPKFSIFKSSINNQYYFRLRATNGEIILNGEGYVTKQSCLAAIASVKLNAPIDSRFERKMNQGAYTFNLKAINGEIIGRSESYISDSGRENGISAVKKDASYAATEDLS